MKRENSKLRNKRRDRRALERAILRAVRYMNYDAPGELSAYTQVQIWGLEIARRAL